MKLQLFRKKILSIDFGGNEIKIVEGQVVNKNINIHKAFTVKLPNNLYNDGEILDLNAIVNLIRDSLKANKVKSDIVHGVINSSKIITRNLTIPEVPENDILSLIKYQLDELLPAPITDFITDYLLVGKRREDGVEKIDILVICIPNQMVLDHFELIKAIGLKPLVLDYQGNSVAKLLEINSSINEFYNIRDMTVASIDLGYCNCKLNIIKNGKLLLTRVITKGVSTILGSLKSELDSFEENRIEELLQDVDISHDIEELNEETSVIFQVRSIIEDLLEEISMIFRFYFTRDWGNAINYIVLQGGLSNVIGIENLFSNYFNIPTLTLKKLDNVRTKYDISKFSNAIGGLIRLYEVL